MTGLAQPGSNSVELASSMPQTLRAYSMTAIWKPKQMPRYGRSFSRAYLTQAILPSLPRAPKPPGTMIASTPSNLSAALASVMLVVSTLLSAISAPQATPACSTLLRMLA